MSTPYQPQGGAACAACGTPFEAGDRFCMSCGAPAVAATVAAAAAVAAAPSTPSCGFCGEPIVPGDTFCGGCGQRVTAPSPLPVAAAPTRDPEPVVAGYCEHCGGTLVDDDAFCQSCGRAVAAEATAATQPIVAPVTAPPAVSSSPRVPMGPAVCPACGVELAEGERFCRSCGRLIKRAGQG